MKLTVDLNSPHIRTRTSVFLAYARCHGEWQYLRASIPLTAMLLESLWTVHLLLPVVWSLSAPQLDLLNCFYKGKEDEKIKNLLCTVADVNFGVCFVPKSQFNPLQRNTWDWPTFSTPTKYERKTLNGSLWIVCFLKDLCLFPLRMWFCCFILYFSSFFVCKYYVNVKYHQQKNPESLSENFWCLCNEFSEKELWMLYWYRLWNLINKGQQNLA